MFKAHTGFTTNGISDDVYFHHEWTSYGDTMELHWTAAKPDLVPKLFLQVKNTKTLMHKAPTRLPNNEKSMYS